MLTWQLLDTMLSYEFDSKPLMSLADVQCTLPGREALWECVDAEGTIIRRSNQPRKLSFHSFVIAIELTVVESDPSRSYGPALH